MEKLELWAVAYQGRQINAIGIFYQLGWVRVHARDKEHAVELARPIAEQKWPRHEHINVTDAFPVPA